MRLMTPPGELGGSPRVHPLEPLHRTINLRGET